jgi:hypothetical protein
MRAVSNLSIILASVVVGLTLCIAADGLLLSRFISDPDFIGPDLYRRTTDGWYMLSPGLKKAPSAWGKSRYPVSSDAHGFRVSDDGPVSRPSHYIFLGDSFTFGINGAWPDTFVGMFEQTAKASVLNAGCYSYSPTAYLFQYRNALAAGLLWPHHTVVVGLDISDVQDEAAVWTDGIDHPVRIARPERAEQAEQAEQAEPSSLRKFLSSHFIVTKSVYRLLRYGRPSDVWVFDSRRSAFTWRTWSEIEDPDPKATHRYDRIGYRPRGIAGGLSRVTEKMRLIAEEAERNGGEIYVLIYPWPAQLRYGQQVFDWEKFASDMCSEIRCRGLINTFPLFRDEPDWYERFYIAGDVHFNTAGSAVVANALARHLLQ